MGVCRFWLQGNCKFGDRCKFDHFEDRRTQYDNRSSSHPRAPASNSRNNQANTPRAASGSLPYQLDKAAILIDLTTERPQWILSAFGPGRFAPAQLFGGPLREQSFEEMRLLHWFGELSGNPQQAMADAATLWTAAEQQIQTAVNDIDGAIQFLISAENQHPNRVDIVKESQTRTAGSSLPNPLNVPPPPAMSQPFGAPSGQPSGSAFGMSSAQPGAFSQVSTLGPTPSPFGVNPPSQTGTFGQPSGMGPVTAPFAAPAFAQADQQKPAGAFGQPAQLGQRPNPFGVPPTGTGGNNSMPNPFGQNTAVTNPFAQSAQLATANPPVAPNAFGAPISNPQPNPFGSTPVSAFGNPSPARNPFGAQSTSSVPFGGQSNTPPNAFGAGTSSMPAPSNLAVPTQPNPFGRREVSSPTKSNPFGQQSIVGPNTTHETKFASAPPQQSSAANGIGMNTDPTAARPPLSSYSTKDASGRLIMFKGKRVVYKGDEPGYQTRDGYWTKIWFPNGPPESFSNITMPDDTPYDDETVAAYKHASLTGKFEGNMPYLPPKPEWISFDF